MRIFAFSLLALLVACGTNPAERTAAADTAADTADTAPDVTPDVDEDVPLEDTTPDAIPCADDGSSCVPSCSGDVIYPAECVNGVLQCPEEAPTPIEECQMQCMGRPGPCCTDDGTRVDPECTAAGWQCPAGSGPSCAPPTGDLIGTWREVGRLGCDGVALPASDDPIAEFRLMGGGEFDLTFSSGMFETFRHYWGTWVFNPGNGEFIGEASSGNMQTDGLDLVGTVRFDDGRALFEGVDFGDPNEEGVAPPCGYWFERE